MWLSSHISEIFLGAHLSSGILVLQIRVINIGLMSNRRTSVLINSNQSSGYELLDQ